MPRHTEHEQEGGGDDATVLPFRRTRSSTQDQWRVERIDTEPMTTQQHDLAVTTLATLITQWRTNQENANETHEKAG